MFISILQQVHTYIVTLLLESGQCDQKYSNIVKYYNNKKIYISFVTLKG